VRAFECLQSVFQSLRLGQVSFWVTVHGGRAAKVRQNAIVDSLFVDESSVQEFSIQVLEPRTCFGEGTLPEVVMKCVK